VCPFATWPNSFSVAQGNQLNRQGSQSVRLLAAAAAACVNEEVAWAGGHGSAAMHPAAWLVYNL
jgi:hypothetical protein